MNKILDVVEDIKPNITEHQYNKIMEALMEIFPLLSENRQLNKLIRLFNWLDTKLEITNNSHDCDTRYVDQWPEEWVLVGRGTADSQATALRPGDVVSESGPPASSPSRARCIQCNWSESVATAG